MKKLNPTKKKSRMKHETNTNSLIAWYSAKQKVYIDNFGTFLSGTMTILHFSRRNCLPTSQRSLCVCILNWIESNFGWDWIKRYPYTSCLLLPIAWRFQRNFRFIFIFMFACSFCWSQVFDTIENQARCHIQWRCVCGSGCICIWWLFIFFSSLVSAIACFSLSDISDGLFSLKT